MAARFLNPPNELFFVSLNFESACACISIRCTRDSCKHYLYLVYICIYDIKSQSNEIHIMLINHMMGSIHRIGIICLYRTRKKKKKYIILYNNRIIVSSRCCKNAYNVLKKRKRKEICKFQILYGYE